VAIFLKMPSFLVAEPLFQAKTAAKSRVKSRATQHALLVTPSWHTLKLANPTIFAVFWIWISK
jgi:hypothetical protein